jgi:hypothetical protein
MAQLDREVWKNVSPGLRYYITLDPIGNQTSMTVQAGRTFTITPLERQMNQQAAYDPKADLFRNGTFVMIKPTDDTNEDEVESPDSLSDGEIEEAVHQALAGETVPIELMLERVTSVTTAQRILEELVLQDAKQSLVEQAKLKVDEFEDKPIGPDGEPMDIVERETVMSQEVAGDEAFRASKAIRPR